MNKKQILSSVYKRLLALKWVDSCFSVGIKIKEISPLRERQFITVINTRGWGTHRMIIPLKFNVTEKDYTTI